MRGWRSRVGNQAVTQARLDGSRLELGEVQGSGHRRRDTGKTTNAVIVASVGNLGVARPLVAPGVVCPP
jgi:hypothetical protein